MGDAGQVKAEVVIAYNGSGIQQAKDDLASFAEMAGALSGGGGGVAGLSDALAGMNDHLLTSGKYLSDFGGMAQTMVTPLQAGQEALSQWSDTLGNHTQMLLGANDANTAFQESLGSTIGLLGDAAPPMTAISEHAQTMAKQLDIVDGSFTEIGSSVSQVIPMLPQFAETLQPVADGLQTVTEQAQEFNKQAVQITDIGSGSSFSLPENMQLQFDQSGRIIGAGAAYIQDQLNGLNQTAEETTAAFTDTNQATASTGGTLSTAGDAAKSANENFANLGASTAGSKESFANLGGAADDTTQSINDLISTRSGIESTFAELKGGQAVNGGGLFGDLFSTEGLDSIANAGMAIDQFMRPLMMIQMSAQMVGQVATGIYNMAAIAEGPGAHGMNTFTGSVDAFNQVASQTGQTFSEAFGNSFKTTLDAIDNTAAQTGGNGGISGIGSFLGGTLGGVADTFMTLGGLSQMIGSGVLNVLSGGNTGFYGASTFEAGIHGFVNLYDQATGQAEQYPNTIAPNQYGAQAATNIQTAIGQGNLSSVQLAQEAGNSQYLQSQDQASAYSGYEQQYQAAYNILHPVTLQDFQAAMKTQADLQYQQVVATQYGITPQQAAAAGITAPMSTLPPGEAVHITGGNGPTTYGQEPTGQGGLPFSQQQATSQISQGQNASSFMSTLGNLYSTGANIVGGIGQGFESFLQNPLAMFGMQSQQQLAPIVGGCFVAGTRVLLADGTEHPIESLRIGDALLAYNGTRRVTTTVLACIVPPARQVYALTFNNGAVLTLTDSHPIATPQGWKALSVAHARLENPDLAMSTLQIGDVVCTVDGTATLHGIEKRGIVQVYNVSVGTPHTFYAGGVLVHNKAGSDMGQQISDQVGGIQLPHIDLSGMASSLAGSFSAIPLPHIDLSSMGANLSGAFSSIGSVMPHIDLSSMASNLGGAFSSIGSVMPHIDLSGIGATLSGAFSGIGSVMPHIDLSGIGSSLSSAFSGISSAIPPINFSGISSTIQSALSGLSSISLPSIPNIAGTINSDIGNMFTGFSLPSIPNIAGAINGTIANMFSGFTLPSIPNIAGMISSALSGMFAGLMIPAFASGVEGFGGGPAIVGEGGSPEVVEHNGQYTLVDSPTFMNLPSGASVYPMQDLSMQSSPRMLAQGTGGDLTPIFLGSVGGGSGAQTANINVYWDSQLVMQMLGASLMQTINVGMGRRSY